jgi:phosphoribosylanthranilate isomerase
MWVKVCGNTNLEDARFAAESGADALGFVFAPSPRQVQAEPVRQIIEQLPRQVEKYGIFVNAGFDEIVATVETAGLTGVQLQRIQDAEIPLRLRQHFGRELKILRVVHYQAEDFEQQLSAFHPGEGVLVDSSNRHAAGGTGTSFNWQEARAGFARAGSHLHLIAAGGLSPDNVRQAIEILRPWGVDAVSGLESAPGKKDPAKVLAFIQHAQAAPVNSF